VLEDVLLDVASRLEPDGGLPGENHEERVLAGLLALLLSAAEGHTARGGAFMPHVQHLLAFLQAADPSPLTGERQKLVRTIIQRLSQDAKLPGPWLALVQAYQAGRWEMRPAWQQLQNLGNQ
jgi:hypothetical protein